MNNAKFNNYNSTEVNKRIQWPIWNFEPIIALKCTRIHLCAPSLYPARVGACGGPHHNNLSSIEEASLCMFLIPIISMPHRSYLFLGQLLNDMCSQTRLTYSYFNISRFTVDSKYLRSNYYGLAKCPIWLTQFIGQIQQKAFHLLTHKMTFTFGQCIWARPPPSSQSLITSNDCPHFMPDISGTVLIVSSK